MSEIEQFADVVVETVKEALADPIARIAALEQRTGVTVDVDAIALTAASLIPAPKDGRDGKDADPEAIKASLSVALQSDIARLMERLAVVESRQPLKGEPGEKGLDGKDGANGLDGPAGRDGIDGKDAEPITPALVLEALSASPSLLQKAVESYLTAHPPPAGKDGAVGLTGKDGKDGRDGMPGVPGRDGEKGLDGKDGSVGPTGRDGTIENLKAVFDGERTLSLCFKNGDPIEGGVITFDIPLDRGVYKDSVVYAKGDIVSWGGSIFIAQRETTAKPETNSDWRLAVKRGRDGKGLPGPKGEIGPKGPKGDPAPRW